MKNKKFLVPVLISAVILISGCATSNGVKLATALAGDPATVDLTVTTPWGGLVFHRDSPGLGSSNNVVQIPVSMSVHASVKK